MAKRRYRHNEVYDDHMGMVTHECVKAIFDEWSKLSYYELGGGSPTLSVLKKHLMATLKHVLGNIKLEVVNRFDRTIGS